MNDEETVALIAGGHTFGKTHGAGRADVRRPRARGRPDRAAGPGLEEHASAPARARDTITSGLEVDLDADADEVGQQLPREPVRLRVGADQEPGRREAVGGRRTPSATSSPTRTTGELHPQADDADHRPRAAGRPDLRARSRGASCEHPDEFAEAFAKAWYKLLHRDMGPVSRYLGPWVPEPQLWQDPVPAGRPRAGRRRRHRGPEGEGPRLRAVRSRSWSRRRGPSAASFRGTDKRGGANGARIRLEPQRDWEVNEPERARPRCCRSSSRSSRTSTASQSGGKKVSLADLIVLGGCAAVEKAARDAGHEITVPFTPGPHRRLAGADRRRVVRGARADGRRVPQLRAARREAAAGARCCSTGPTCSTLTAPEMTVLIGGLRALGANAGGTKHGVFTDRPGRADQRLLRQPARHGHGVEAVASEENVYEGRDRATGEREVDGDRGRPGVRLATRSCGPSPRSTRSDDARREVRAGLRRRVGQGHEPRPVRPALSSAPSRPAGPPGRPRRGYPGPDGSGRRRAELGRPGAGVWWVG